MTVVDHLSKPDFFIPLPISPLPRKLQESKSFMSFSFMECPRTLYRMMVHSWPHIWRDFSQALSVLRILPANKRTWMLRLPCSASHLDILPPGPFAYPRWKCAQNCLVSCSTVLSHFLVWVFKVEVPHTKDHLRWSCRVWQEAHLALCLVHTVFHASMVKAAPTRALSPPPLLHLTRCASHPLANSTCHLSPTEACFWDYCLTFGNS